MTVVADQAVPVLGRNHRRRHHGRRCYGCRYQGIGNYGCCWTGCGGRVESVLGGEAERWRRHLQTCAVCQLSVLVSFCWKRITVYATKTIVSIIISSGRQDPTVLPTIQFTLRLLILHTIMCCLLEKLVLFQSKFILHTIILRRTLVLLYCFVELCVLWIEKLVHVVMPYPTLPKRIIVKAKMIVFTFG